MFKKEYILSYIKWGIISAIAFCIPMIIFVNSGDYQNTWLLFLGNGLFLVAIAAYMLSFNKMKGGDASTQTQMAAGHIATIAGIIISCIVAAIAIAVFIPDVFSPGLADNALENAPAQTGTGKTHGLIFFVFMNATIGNLCGGSFVSLILPYTAKRDQTKDRKSEVLNN
jgi:predicted ABC-type exoprotein transport system permease subunit